MIQAPVAPQGKEQPLQPPSAKSSPTDESSSAGLGFRAMLALILLSSCCLYVTMAANWAKFSRAEVFFAECSREMLKHNNFVTPLYHSQPFFDKPILAYWLIVVLFKLFGTSHLTARIPSIVAALFTVALTGTAGRMLFGKRAGLLAAMALSSSFMFFSFSNLCMSDMLLVMFDCISLSLLYAGCLLNSKRTLLWFLASASMGLAFLTKGPVGIVLPALSFVVYLAATRQLLLVRPVHVLIAVVTASVVAAPWFLAAYQANGMAAITYFFIRENFQRFAGSTYDTHKPFWFMAASLFTGFAPWSAFLPVILYDSIRKWRQGLGWPRQELFLWCWVAVVTVFFSFSRGKCDYYVLPAYPGAAMLVGLYLSRWIEKSQRPALTGGWGLAVSYITVGIASCFILAKIVPGAFSQWFLMPMLLVISGALVAAAMYRQRVMQAYAIAFAGICLAGSGFALQILPAISHMQLTAFYTKSIRQSPPDTVIGVDASLSHWIDEITFQTGREPVKIDNTDALEKLLSGTRPALVIIPQNEFDKLPQQLFSQIRVAKQTTAISHALTPGYAVQRNGNLADPLPLLLVTNQR